MFKFSYNWLKAESEIETDYEELLHWLDIQGFEIASIEDYGDDKAVDIEVKANTPDMLSVAGVLREYYAGKGRRQIKDFLPKDVNVSFGSDNSVLSHKIVVDSKDVHRYCATEIRNVDNTGKTPEYIKDRLTKSGIACINPIVDISNYVLLQIGQPIHIFDADKVKGDIRIENVPAPTKFTTLASTEIELPTGALLISDDENPLCVAGIIGGHAPEVTESTKNIIIESANFDHIIERVTSKKTHVQTAASYRFERGVSPATAKLGALICVKMITELCGGEYNNTGYMYTDGTSTEPQKMVVTKKRINSLLGSDLDIPQISKFLNDCFFETECEDGENITVTIPDFRLDIDYDVDVIEEVGRMYGYHNIEPQPVKLFAPYVENPVNKNANKLRDIMVGFGFIEVLTYGFIPGNSMEMLHIKQDSEYYGDIKILNPLSNFYELMRPSLAYGLISTAIANMSVGKGDLRIFEVGKRFFRQKDYEDGYNEKNVFAALMTGVKLGRGFGITKDAKFSVYDAVSLLDAVMREYNLKYEIKPTDELGMFEAGAGGDIYVCGRRIGYLGKIDPKVLGEFENGKLARDDVAYLEFCFEGFDETKRCIEFDSMYPSVTREYNFLVKNGIHFTDYAPVIKEASGIIVNVSPRDVYTGAGVPKGFTSVLIRIEYNDPTRTLDLEEISGVEAVFMKALADKFGIALKL